MDTVIWGFAYNFHAAMISLKMNVMGVFLGLSKWTKAVKKDWDYLYLGQVLLTVLIFCV